MIVDGAGDLSGHRPLRRPAPYQHTRRPTASHSGLSHPNEERRHAISTLFKRSLTGARSKPITEIQLSPVETFFSAIRISSEGSS
jgi:hypothetical protein